MTSREIPRAQDQLFQRGGARAKYSRLVVGRPGWGALLKHELVVTIAQPPAGALGLALRKWMYPWLLGSCGRDVVFGQNVVLRHPHKIHIGDRVVIDDNCLLDAKGEANAGIKIASGVFIGRNTILSCKNGDIFSASRVTIGRGTLVAAYAYLVGGDHDFADRDKAVLDQRRTSKGIAVGDGAWIGAGAKILDGVTVGDRAIVGAGAVVRDAVPAGATAVGIPARVLEQRGPRES